MKNSVRSACLSSIESIEGVGHAIFKTSSSKLIYDDWKLVIKDDTTNEDEQIQAAQLTSLEEKQNYLPIASKIESKQTKPPKRFTETALVKALEQKGIGRPSTYGSIITVLLNSEYVVINKSINDYLNQHHSVRSSLTH